MRKIITTIVALVLAFAVLLPVEAFAELPDFASMTDEELHDLINAARNELTNRDLIFNEDTVLIDQDGVKVYLTGKYQIQEYYYPEGLLSVNFEAIVINDTDKMVSIMFDSSTVNGWDVSNDGINEVSAGHKKKAELKLYISEADISTYEEIEDAVFALYVYDDDNWNTLFHVDPVTVQFN